MSFNYQIRARLIIPHKNELLLEYTADHDFYFYPGGRVENYETVKETAEREMKEELNAEFTFKKIVYIAEYIDKKIDEHSLELFILGELDHYDVKKNPDDPDFKESHEFVWIGIDKLPENLLPKSLTKILIEDFYNDFPEQGKYLGARD